MPATRRDVAMIHIHSKITSQGQVSAPVAVQGRLGLRPGATLEWIEEAGQIVVRRAVLRQSSDIHAVLFPEGTPQRKSLKELRQGVAQAVRERHARD
jgi:bifunctional DNA-binding transcriptional regulator/antitoxin component of YhaV-PrlF toxin-antitoxin module